jgi:hypothetical protein
MEAIARPAGGRVLTVVATLLAATHMVDFIFYGMHAHDALGGIGMALIAHGAYHGVLGTGAAVVVPADQAAKPAGGTTARARSAAVLGVSLVIASVVFKYLLPGVFAWA